MNFPSLAIQLLKQGTKKIALISDGGYGKTTSLLELYRLLLCDGSFVPIYVPLGSVTDGDDSIVRYIGEKYCFGAEARDLRSKVLDIEGDFKFAVILDGGNENVHSDSFAGEISKLTELRAVSVIYSSRVYVDSLKDWELYRFEKISDQVIEKYIPGSPLTDMEFLRTPFYLSKYVEMQAETPFENGVATPYALLDKYLEFTVDKFKNLNSTSSVGDEKVSKAADKAVNRMVELCCELVAKRELEFLADSELNSELNIYSRDILEPMGFVVSLDDSVYRVSHQIYRDFFAARRIARFYDKLKHKSDQLLKLLSEDLTQEVLDFFCESLAENDLGLCADRINDLVNEDFRQKPYLNRNIVELFKRAGRTIEGIDLSDRDLTKSSFDGFDRILDCDFRGSSFSSLSFRHLNVMPDSLPEHQNCNTRCQNPLFFGNYLVYARKGELIRLDVESGEAVILYRSAGRVIYAEGFGKFSEELVYLSDLKLLSVKTGKTERILTFAEYSECLKKRQSSLDKLKSINKSDRQEQIEIYQAVYSKKSKIYYVLYSGAPTFTSKVNLGYVDKGGSVVHPLLENCNISKISMLGKSLLMYGEFSRDRGLYIYEKGFDKPKLLQRYSYSTFDFENLLVSGSTVVVFFQFYIECLEYSTAGCLKKKWEVDQNPIEMYVRENYLCVEDPSYGKASALFYPDTSSEKRSLRLLRPTSAEPLNIGKKGLGFDLWTDSLYEFEENAFEYRLLKLRADEDESIKRNFVSRLFVGLRTLHPIYCNISEKQLLFLSFETEKANKVHYNVLRCTYENGEVFLERLCHLDFDSTVYSAWIGPDRLALSLESPERNGDDFFLYNEKGKLLFSCTLRRRRVQFDAIKADGDVLYFLPRHKTRSISALNMREDPPRLYTFDMGVKGVKLYWLEADKKLLLTDEFYKTYVYSVAVDLVKEELEVQDVCTLPCQLNWAFRDEKGDLYLVDENLCEYDSDGNRLRQYYPFMHEMTGSKFDEYTKGISQVGKEILKLYGAAF